MPDFDQFIANAEAGGQATVEALTGGAAAPVPTFAELAAASLEEGQRFAEGTELRTSTVLTQTTIPRPGMDGGGLLLLLGLGALAVFLASR